jgi:type II secretory pathway pseudopilin PulG
MKPQRSNIKMAGGRRAFTLVELMVASGCLVILIGSVIMCNLFGLAMAVRQQMWLGASDDAAHAVGTLTEDIRSAVSLQVGTNAGGAFTPTGTSGRQAGTALMIFTNSTATTSAGPWILYYYDTVSNNLVRSNFYGAGNGGDYRLVSANPITNDVTHPIFSEVDFTGNTLGAATNNSCPPISVYLSFTSLQNPQIIIESGSAVDLYQIITTITPRTGL